jgi:hypothetical protein
VRRTLAHSGAPGPAGGRGRMARIDRGSSVAQTQPGSLWEWRIFITTIILTMEVIMKQLLETLWPP